MPRQLVYSQVPVQLSIVEYDLDKSEDMFLTYDWGRKHGPAIIRTGEGDPYMPSVYGLIGDVTDPVALRQGTWLIREEFRQREIEEIRGRLGNPHVTLSATDRETLERDLVKLQSIWSHTQVFAARCPGYTLLGQQGCGDLTMNMWNVAYVSSPLGRNHGQLSPIRKQDEVPELICLDQERDLLRHRTYSCLVKWKASSVGKVRLTIEDVRFDKDAPDGNGMVRVCWGGEWYPRGDLMEFAVSNQQVIRSGEIVPANTISHKFGDLRHLLRMPNANPGGGPLYPGDSGRPRSLFNTSVSSDVWFGERDLLDHPNRQRASLGGPVFVELPCHWKLAEAALEKSGYHRARSDVQALSPGEWRFVRCGPRESDMKVEIHFQRNVYGWTMLGLSSDNRRILCLACTASRDPDTGYILEDAAQQLLQAGAHNALLIDEGGDVFQTIWEAGGPRENVNRSRGRLRATFIFARREEG
jgi:hypothetical protein